MAKYISRKRKRRGASEGEVSFESQESMLSGLEQLDVDNATLFDDSASESVFNRPLEKSFTPATLLQYPIVRKAVAHVCSIIVCVISKTFI